MLDGKIAETWISNYFEYPYKSRFLDFPDVLDFMESIVPNIIDTVGDAWSIPKDFRVSLTTSPEGLCLNATTGLEPSLAILNNLKTFHESFNKIGLFHVTDVDPWSVTGSYTKSIRYEFGKDERWGCQEKNISSWPNLTWPEKNSAVHAKLRE